MAKASGTLDLKSLKVAGEGASKYITAIDQNGIKVHAENNPNLNYTKINAEGMEVHQNVNNADTKVASFGTNGSQIGVNGKSHIMQDYQSMKMVDRNGNTYFAVGDLRGQDGTFTQTDTFTGDGSTHQFEPLYVIENEYISTLVVKVNNVTKTLDTDYEFDYNMVYLYTAPANGATITLTYTTGNADAKYYTFGIRDSGNVGPMSIAGGYKTVASGEHSVALGYYSVASGYNSVALGTKTVAQSANQLVLGVLNKVDTNGSYSFIIGGGTDDGISPTRKNVFTIDSYGKVETAQMQSGTINSVSVSANSYKDVSVKFPKQMSRIPTVVCTVYSVSTAGAIGNINAAVTYTSSTGFTCRIFNAGSTAREPAVNWIAMNV